MPITIARSDVKRKCMVPTSDTSHDSAIDALIAEMQPALETTIEPVYLEAGADPGITSAVKLGILEMISAEYLAQRSREPGFAEEFQVGGVRVGQVWERGKLLREQATARLLPFQKAMTHKGLESHVLSNAGPKSRRFTDETMAGW